MLSLISLKKGKEVKNKNYKLINSNYFRLKKIQIKKIVLIF